MQEQALRRYSRISHSPVVSADRVMSVLNDIVLGQQPCRPRTLGPTMSWTGVSLWSSWIVSSAYDYYRAMTPRFVPDLIDIEQDLFEIPRKVTRLVVRCQLYRSTLFQERVTYDKDVQTADVLIETRGPSEDEIRQQILREKDTEAEKLAREKELEEENAKLEKEIEQEIRGALFDPFDEVENMLTEKQNSRRRKEQAYSLRLSFWTLWSSHQKLYRGR